MLFFFALHFFFFFFVYALHFFFCYTFCAKSVYMVVLRFLILGKFIKDLSKCSYAMIFERLIDEMLCADHQDFCLLVNQTFMNV
jgi:hypothetical protein